MPPHTVRRGAIRVLLADDHPLLRAGIAAVLGAQPDMTVVAEAGDGRAAVELFRTHRPDIVLMDVRMPVMDGVAATRAIRANSPTARVVAVTAYDGDADIRRVLEAGARGYLLKDMLAREMVATIRAVYRGQRVVPPAVAARMAEHVAGEAVTSRELDVLRLMADGRRNKEIAWTLARSENTVKIHVRHIFEKLGVSDRTEAVTVALRRGILSLP